jgi:hypothetical protein
VWRLTIRSGPRVKHLRFPDLAAALAALSERGQQLASETSRAPVDVKIRRFEPVEQVAARLELAGPERLFPRVRAGIDIRGDGSSEAYLGRVQRELVKQRKGETAFAALARTLGERAGAA